MGAFFKEIWLNVIVKGSFQAFLVSRVEQLRSPSLVFLSPYSLLNQRLNEERELVRVPTLSFLSILRILHLWSPKCNTLLLSPARQVLNADSREQHQSMSWSSLKQWQSCLNSLHFLPNVYQQAVQSEFRIGTANSSLYSAFIDSGYKICMA